MQTAVRAAHSTHARRLPWPYLGLGVWDCVWVREPHATTNGVGESLEATLSWMLRGWLQTDSLEATGWRARAGCHPQSGTALDGHWPGGVDWDVWDCSRRAARSVLVVAPVQVVSTSA